VVASCCMQIAQMGVSEASGPTEACSVFCVPFKRGCSSSQKLSTSRQCSLKSRRRASVSRVRSCRLLSRASSVRASYAESVQLLTRSSCCHDRRRSMQRNQDPRRPMTNCSTSSPVVGCMVPIVGIACYWARMQPKRTTICTSHVGPVFN